ncbi:MAG: biopolymer transporter ExbD [Lentisphaeria bacterium]|nr:biopolymer transporter ExbD [Lentisphaeria bacterium]
MKRRHNDSVETPVASLIDVVFLLIIFFVVTASIETDVVDDTIKLAQAKNSEGVKDVPPNRLTINIREDGSMNIAKQKITKRKLESLLRSLHKNVGDNLTILMRCDGEVRYEHVSSVQEVITEAGYYKVNLVAVAGK